jgi:hypothetical protein
VRRGKHAARAIRLDHLQGISHPAFGGIFRQLSPGLPGDRHMLAQTANVTRVTVPVFRAVEMPAVLASPVCGPFHLTIILRQE